MKYPQRESSVLEFKRDFPKNDQIIKTVVGFCNQNGGKLVIGVDDDGTVVGISEKEMHRGVDTLGRAIYQACTPPIVPLVYSQVLGERRLLIVEVSPGMLAPYYRTSEGPELGTYIRLGPTTVRANASLLEELRWRSRGVFYDQIAVYNAGPEEIDRERVEEFLAQRRNHHKTKATPEVLRSYELLVEEHGQTFASVAGLLLFGYRPQKYLPEATIICSHFRGTSGRDAMASHDCEGPLFQQLDEAMTFLRSRLYHGFKIEGLRREEFLELPEKALREMVINAIIHRNYHVPGPTKIAIFDDRVEVFSPGTFPGPIDGNNLDQGLSYLRNHAIGKVFRERGYIEKLGSGYLTLFKMYKEAGLLRPSVVEGLNFVKVILPRVPAPVEAREEPFSHILALFDRVDQVQVKDLVEQLGVARSTAGRYLKELVRRKEIKRHGSGRTIYYTRDRSI